MREVMPMWVLLDFRDDGQIGAWISRDPFLNGRTPYTFPASPVAEETLGKALRSLAREIEAGRQPPTEDEPDDPAIVDSA
jgi:hypothetical protein